MKLNELAARLDCRLEGDGEIDIVRVAGIRDAQPGDITFVANVKYISQLASTRASAVIVSTALQQDVVAAKRTCALLLTDDPYSAFARALTCFARAAEPAKGIDTLSSIAPDATLGKDVSIGPFVAIGAAASVGARTVIYPNVVVAAGARVGDDCVLHSHVSIREGAVVGNRVVLHDGVVVGSDGFGFARQPDGTHLKIPQQAAIVIEDDVEIGANCALDRPAVGETRIRAGTKIDNLVHVAHGVTIGERSLLAAQSGIAGSTTIDSDVMIAGQSGVTGHVHIGRGVKVGAKSAVLQSVDAGAFVTGHPAMPHADWRKASAVFRRLPAFKKRVVDLERRVAELEQKLAECPTPTDR